MAVEGWTAHRWRLVPRRPDQPRQLRCAAAEEIEHRGKTVPRAAEPASKPYRGDRGAAASPIPRRAATTRPVTTSRAASQAGTANRARRSSSTRTADPLRRQAAQRPKPEGRPPPGFVCLGTGPPPVPGLAGAGFRDHSRRAGSGTAGFSSDGPPACGRSRTSRTFPRREAGSGPRRTRSGWSASGGFDIRPDGSVAPSADQSPAPLRGQPFDGDFANNFGLRVRLLRPRPHRRAGQWQRTGAIGPTRDRSRCRLAVGPIRKRLRVFGDRWWSVNLAGAPIAAPEPFLPSRSALRARIWRLGPLQRRSGRPPARARNPVGQGLVLNPPGRSDASCRISRTPPTDHCWHHRPAPAGLNTIACRA